MPVALLEQLKGKVRKQRIEVLGSGPVCGDLVDSGRVTFRNSAGTLLHGDAAAA